MLTNPAAPPSPASSPTAYLEDKACAQPKPAPTARIEPAFPNQYLQLPGGFACGKIARHHHDRPGARIPKIEAKCLDLVPGWSGAAMARTPVVARNATRYSRLFG